MSRLLLSAALLMTVVAAPLATVIVPATLEELTREAELIAHGRVVAVDARQQASGRVQRTVTLDVVRYLKGNGGSSLQFVAPGGTFGRYRTVTPGAPAFDLGDDVVLFLVQSGVPVPRIVGFNQGVYRVVTDPQTGLRSIAPAVLQNALGEPVPIRRGESGHRVTTLDALESRIASIVLARPADRGPR